MCVGGEFLCLKTELKEIPVGYAALNQKADVWFYILCNFIALFILMSNNNVFFAIAVFILISLNMEN